MNKPSAVLILTLFLLPTDNNAQDSLYNINNFYKGGLTLSGGIGYIAVLDEFISDEKYSGNGSYFIINWSKYYTDYKFIIAFEILNSARIKNYNVSAELIELSLNLSYLYSIGELKIFNKKTNFFLGPMPELFIHYRTQNLSRGGTAILDAYSFSTLISMGSKLNADVQLSDIFQLEASFQSTIISFGGKFIDPADKEKSMIKLTTLFNDLRLSFDFSLRYFVLSNLSLTAGYKFNLINTRSWDYMISASDNFLISLSYSF